MRISSLRRLFLLLAAVPLLCASLADAEANPHPVKIGVVCPLSGPLAVVGQTVKNSVAMADQEFDISSKVEFIIEDDQFIPKNTVTAVQKLIEIDKVSGLITFGSTTSLSVADMAQQHKIPLVAIAMSEKLTENRNFVFRHVTEPVTQIALIAREMRKRAYKTIGIVAASQDATLALRDALVIEAPAKIIVNEEVLPSEADLKALASKIRVKNPDAVFLSVLPPQLSILSRELRRSGYQGQFFSGIQGQNKHEIEVSNGALAGLIFASPDDRNAKNFYELYFKMFGQHAVPDAAEAYDVATLFIRAADSEEIRSSLAGTLNFSGIFGVYSASPKRTFALAGVLKHVNSEGNFEILN